MDGGGETFANAKPAGLNGRNRRSVWMIATEPYPDAHFATFPEKLVEPCILAGTSARGACPTCGAPWARAVERGLNIHPGSSHDHARDLEQGGTQVRADGIAAGTIMRQRFYASTPPMTTGWSPSCACQPADAVPCRVLDPFAGSGTTVAVAERLGRVGIGVELKAAYLRLAWARTRQAGLL
jgi:DNA methylase